MTACILTPRSYAAMAQHPLLTYEPRVQTRLMGSNVETKGIFMFTRRITERKRHLLLAPAVLALLFLAACGSSKPATTPSTHQSVAIATSLKNGSAATATLIGAPTGKATLNWDNTNHMLTVQIMLTGLAPNSSHPMRIVQGKCGASGQTLYSLQNLVADSHGAADESVKVSAPKGIPASGWTLRVYNGPGLTTMEQAVSLVCASIANPNTSLKSPQIIQVPLDSSPSIGQNGSGNARLTISDQTLTVQMTVNGLVPNSEHMAHIHSGTCVSQGPVVYAFPVLKANAEGQVSITATFPHVSTIPATGWYINIHRGTDLSAQTGFDPVACGNITLN